MIFEGFPKQNLVFNPESGRETDFQKKVWQALTANTYG